MNDCVDEVSHRPSWRRARLNNHSIRPPSVQFERAPQNKQQPTITPIHIPPHITVPPPPSYLLIHTCGHTVGMYDMMMIYTW